MRTLNIVVSLLFIIACTSKKKVVTAPVSTAPVAASPFSETEMARATSKFPGITMDQLVHGKTLYEGQCGTCHGLKKVGDFTEAEWIQINPGMVKKANKYKNANIDAEAEKAILQYVITLAKQ